MNMRFYTNMQGYPGIIARGLVYVPHFVYRGGRSFCEGIREFPELYNLTRKNPEGIWLGLFTGNPDFIECTGSDSSEKPHNLLKSTLPLDTIVRAILFLQRRVKGE